MSDIYFAVREDAFLDREGFASGVIAGRTAGEPAHNASPIKTI